MTLKFTTDTDWINLLLSGLSLAESTAGLRSLIARCILVSDYKDLRRAKEVATLLSLLSSTPDSEHFQAAKLHLVRVALRATTGHRRDASYSLLYYKGKVKAYRQAKWPCWPALWPASARPMGPQSN